MSGSALSKAWRWSVEVSPVLHAIRWIGHRGYPNRKAFGLLDAAGLPKPVDTLIRKTVRKSKLWASERAEIARELITHTQDAIEAGRSSEEIASTFGDPKRIAKLMRRSMKRKRPLYWRAYRNMKRATGVMVVLLVVGYSSLAVRFYLGKPEIKRNFIAELNARDDGYSEDQKAWGVYQEADIAWQRHTREARKKQWAQAQEREMDRGDGVDRPWAWYRAGLDGMGSITQEHPDYLEVVELVREFEPWITRIREAAQRPALGLLYSDRSEEVEIEDGIKNARVLAPSDDPAAQGALVEVLLPNLGMMRKFTYMLKFDTQLAIESGDSQRATADMLGQLGLAKQSKQQGFLISDMVGIAILNLLVQDLNELLLAYPDSWTRDQLVSLTHAISTVQSLPALGLEIEAMFFDDMLQRAYTDDGHGNGRMTKEGLFVLSGMGGMSFPDGPEFGVERAIRSLTGPVTLVMMGDRKTQYDLYHGVMDTTRRVLDEGPESIGHLGYLKKLSRARVKRGLGLNYSPVDLFMPAMTRAVDRAFQSQLSTQAAMTMLAIEIYRLDHGQLPELLDELVPKYLPSVPQDPFNPGFPLQYVVDETGYMVYAAGADGDLDGGVQIDPEVDRGQFRWLSRRFSFEIERGDDGMPSIVRDANGLAILLEPDTPDSDWVLIDMRRGDGPINGE